MHHRRNRQEIQDVAQTAPSPRSVLEKIQAEQARLQTIRALETEPSKERLQIAIKAGQLSVDEALGVAFRLGGIYGLHAEDTFGLPDDMPEAAKLTEDKWNEFAFKDSTVVEDTQKTIEHSYIIRPLLPNGI